MLTFLHSYRPPVAARAEPHPLSEGFDGVYRLIHTTPNIRDKALFALCGFCGLRVAEAVTVRKESIDIFRRTLMVDGKGAKQRIVPISDRAFMYLFPAWVATEPGERIVALAIDTARKWISEHGRAVGVSLSSHDLRATFATEVYGRTKDLAAVQQLLGHANVDTTRAYVAVSEATLRLAVNAS